MRALAGWSAFARLEWGEVRRSRWLALTFGCYLVLGAMLVVAGTRESSVFGYTGMARTLLSFAHVLLVVLPLLALSATTQVLPRAREDGSLELFFAQPLSRAGYLVGISLSRMLALSLPFVGTQLVLAGLGRLWFAEPIAWPMLARTLSIGLSLLWCFTGIGLLVSVQTRAQAKAVVYGLLAWALSVALVDVALLAVLLQWKLHARVVFFLAAINPVQLARLGLLAGIEPDLTSLGPVGFYLATQLGAGVLSWLGALGPLAVGTGCWLLASRRFARGDLM